jgi:transcriptional regulator with XRE-family HTH domain
MRTIVRCTTVFLNLVLFHMDVMKTFGNKIKDLRILQGYSQEELANRAGIDRTYISDIEKGERNVSLKIIEKLAISFKMEIHELFTK